MQILVKVYPNSKKLGIKTDASGMFLIHVREKAVGGRANEAVAQALAEYLAVKKYQLKLVRGHKTRVKIFEVNV